MNDCICENMYDCIQIINLLPAVGKLLYIKTKNIGVQFLPLNYLSPCMHVCTYVCTCIYVCMHVCIYMYVCKYVCMYVYMYVCMYVCIYVWYVCM